MNIKEVHVTGLHATMPALVQPTAASLMGQNALRANKKAVARSVEQIPTIESARVVMHPDVPPRIELQVVERKPIMRVGSQGSWWVADEKGNPYRTANAHDAKLPALTWGAPIETLKPLDSKRWDEAVELAQAVEANLGQKGMDSLSDIRSMQLDEGGDATLVLAAGNGAPDLTLKLGNDQWSEKLARARTARLYFARTNRRAVELNLVSLELPRWTPQASANTSAGTAPPSPTT